MAEAIFNKQVNRDKGIAYSAGIYAYPGDSISKNAGIVLAEDYGIAADGHVSSVVTEDHILEADEVLTMTSKHKAMLLEIYPKHKEKIHTLYEFAYNKAYEDISDPYGGSIEEYRKCAREIEKIVMKVIENENLA